MKEARKALLVATTASMIEQFNQNNIHVLQDMGYEVHVVCNFERGNTISDSKVHAFYQALQEQGVKVFDMPISRPPLAYGRNFYSCLQLRRLIKKEKYDIIHCHTPMGSVVARIAAYTVRNWHGRVIYTAHGFHFFKGAPRINHVLYGNVERLLAHFTDCIVTINEEDYRSALTFDMKDDGSVYKIPGVGVDVKGIQSVQADESLRESLGIDDHPFILSVGELNANKNHRVILEAMRKMRNKDFVYLVCGKGNEQKNLQQLADNYGLQNRFRMLGYRDDVIEIMHLAEIYVHPSYREGLSVALMQAMAAGLPVVASRIRGNIDLIEPAINGLLCDPDDSNGFAESLDLLLDNKPLRDKFAQNNKEKIKQYDTHRVNSYMEQIYGDF